MRRPVPREPPPLVPVALACLSLAGCACRPAPSPAGAGMALREFCLGFFTQVLLQQYDCLGASGQAYDTQTSVLNACTELEKGIAAGRILYDGSQGQPCLDQLKTLTCQEVDSGALGGGATACDLVLSGAVADGASCYSNGDCSTESYCTQSPSQCPGACAPRIPIGGACGPARCVDGAACLQSRRVAKVGLEQPCGAGIAACLSPLACLDSAAGKTCQALKTSGSCTAPYGECAPNYACVRETATSGTGTCQPAKPLGENCTAGKRECELMTACISGKCQVAIEGTRCGAIDGEQVVCAMSTCDANPQQGTPTGVCRPLKQLGEDCSAAPCALQLSCDDATLRCVANCLEP